MSSAIIQLFSKMNLLKEGIARWEGSVKNQAKGNSLSLRSKNSKRKSAKVKKGKE